jgi:predicted Rossmann fold flavoprotein
MSVPVVVVGCGAAGLLAAIFAAEGGARTLLLERTRDGGRKILISGGGRCNVLPSVLDPERFVTASSRHVMKRLLRSWPLAEQRRFFEERLGLRLVREAETGKLFPASNRARDVRDGLVELARVAGVELRFGTAIQSVRPPSGGRGWRLKAETGELDAAAVVLATGGLSVPATGSDGTGLRIAAELGHRTTELYPALTPLTADPPRHAHLAGVSLSVRLEAPGSGGKPTAGGFLFTHRGYSGPAVLDISHVAVRSRLKGGPRQPIFVQWSSLDAEAWGAMLTEQRSGTLGALVRRRLPDRLADTLLLEAGVDPQRPLSQLRREERTRIVAALTRYALPWSADEGYKKAEVTGGGVALNDIDPTTLESRRHPGLYLCGEMLDAFGPIGGYNFAWAWATGRAAGRAVATHVREGGA